MTDRERTSPEAILDRAHATDRAQVWRHRDGQWGHCGAYDPRDVRQFGYAEFVAARGGGGKYRIRVRRSDGTYGQQFTFTVEGPPRPWHEPGDASSSSSAASSSSSAPAPAAAYEPPSWVRAIIMPFAGALGTALATKLVAMLFEGGRGNHELLLKLLEQRNGSGAGVDPIELQKILDAREERGESRGRQLGKLLAERSEPREPREPAAGVAAAIDRNLPEVMSVLRAKIESDERRASRAARGAPPAAPPATDAPVVEGADAPAAPGAPPAPDVSDPLVALLLGVPYIARELLLSAAKGDEAPNVYAALVLTKLDQVTRRRLPQLLERDDVAAVICSSWAPAFEPYREWVDEFVDALRDTVAANPPEDDDQAPSSSAAGGG